MAHMWRTARGTIAMMIGAGPEVRLRALRDSLHKSSLVVADEEARRHHTLLDSDRVARVVGTVLAAESYIVVRLKLACHNANTMFVVALTDSLHSAIADEHMDRQGLHSPCSSSLLPAPPRQTGCSDTSLAQVAA